MDVIAPTVYPPTGGDFLANYSSPVNSLGSLFYHTYGFTSGLTYFGARVSGDGTFYGQTSAKYSTQVENTGSSALSGFFNFNVDSGQLGVFGAGSGSAELVLDVRKNGTSLTKDFTRIEYDGTTDTSTCSDAGSAGTLAGYMACGTVPTNGGYGLYASGGPYSVAFSVDPGATITLDYDIIATVSGAFTGGAVDCNFYGGGNLGLAAAANFRGDGQPPPETVCHFFNAIARSGDPAGVSLANNPTAPGTADFNVPEPGALALVGLALAGLGVSRKRRVRQA